MSDTVWASEWARWGPGQLQQMNFQFPHSPPQIPVQPPSENH